MKIDVENKTLTELLGYLSLEAWKEAVKSEELCEDKELVKKLMKIQDEIYETNLQYLCDIDEA